MGKTFSASGLLTECDIKRLAGMTRAGTVGPTAVYYAGVTAPLISTGTGLLTHQVLATTAMSLYWQTLLSALIAALAGIGWYFIFMRWSYRHSYGRGTETRTETRVIAGPDGLTISRGVIRTHIGWAAVKRVTMGAGDTAIIFDGADALIIPDQWFDQEIERLNFKKHLAEWAPATEFTQG